ncbi:MAG: GreA/GreB family elongation factor [Porticoccus sp.]|nr:GreA/GreB family elongation factor [Porticoccus sp.]
MLPLVSQVRKFIYLSSKEKNYSSLASRCILNAIELSSVLDKLEKYYHSDTDIDTSNVALIGKKITLYDYIEDLTMDITLTLPEDSDPSIGKISVLSPLGGLLLGSKVDDNLTLYLGNTTTQFKVRAVSEDN